MSRRSVRSRTRPTGRIGKVTARAGKAARADLRDLASSARKAVKARSTQVRCPYCPGLPWINGSAWPGHEAAHKATATRKQRARQRTDALADRDRRRRDAEHRAHDARSRPPNRQADPGGVIHAAMRPQDREPSPHVFYVDDDGQRIDWSPGEPLPGHPKPKPTPPNQVWGEGSGGYRTGLGAALRQLFTDGARAARGRWADGWRVDRDAARRGWGRLVAPFRARPRRTPSTDGARWKARTRNPGAQTPPTNVIPLRPDPKEPPVATTTTPPSGRAKPAPKKPTRGSAPGGGTAAGTGGGTGHAEEMASAAMGWARAMPETLAGARNDAQTMTEGLAGVAGALIQRMNGEVERSISPACVEPYQEAANLLKQAAERVQEVHARLLQRYQMVAEELAKPDTPDPDYLKEGV